MHGSLRFRSMKSFLHLALVMGAFVLIGCGQRSSAPPKSDSAGQQVQAQKSYPVRGVIKKVEASEKSVTIQHAEVPNYMPAMTMPFKVRDARLLEGLQPGDVVSFRLNVADESAWIDQIAKQSTAQQVVPQTRPEVRLTRNVEPLKEGDMMPDYRFTNELGQAISLNQFKGQALALTFIFTRCPMPDFCPLLSRNFSAATQQLGGMPNGTTNWHFFSISFDPHFDQPPILKAYAQRYKYDPAKWSFVTGAMIDIDAITEQFDLPVMKIGENWDHKLRTVVIDATGRIQKIFIGNQWKSDELAAEIVKGARVASSGG
jgi:protein SCO1